jgi:hypothetical protein
MAKQKTWSFTSIPISIPYTSDAYSMIGCTRALFQVQINGDGGTLTIRQNNITTKDLNPEEPEGIPVDDSWYTISTDTHPGGSSVKNYLFDSIHGTKFIDITFDNSFGNSDMKVVATLQELETYPAR